MATKHEKPGRIELLLSAYGAMTGYVHSDLVLLSIEIGEDEIQLHALYEGLIDDEKADLIECIATEIQADVGPYYNVTTDIQEPRGREVTPQLPGYVIFGRFEGWN